MFSEIRRRCAGEKHVTPMEIHHFIWIQATIISWLVVWNMNFMTFHILGIIIIPTDELIFFRGVGLNHHFICRLSTSTGDKRREITKLGTSHRLLPKCTFFWGHGGHAMPRAMPISELTQGLSQQHQSLGKFDACGRSAGCCLCCLEDLWYRWVHEKTTYGDGSKAMNSHILLGYFMFITSILNIHLPAIK